MKDTTILTNNGINVQASLELFGDMEMYDETLGDFLDMTDEKISSLENFKNANDMPNYAIAVHALKSDGRYLGFTTLADLCYESEMKSKAGDSVFVQENHPKILAEAKRVINLAQQYMGREITAVIPEGSAPAPAVEATPAPVMEAAPAAVPVAAVETTPVAPAPVTMEQQVVYQQSSPVPQEVTMQAMPAQPQVMAQPQPVMQTVPVQTMQTAPVQPVQQAPVMEATPAPVPTAAPITPDTTGVTINFSNAVQQPIATPMTQEVQQQVMTQPVEPVVQPVVETQATVSREPTIQFFPADNFQQNDLMSQALYMQQQPMGEPPAAVKQGIILVVDDSPLVSNFVKKIFSKNYDVLIASDGQKAIDIVNDDSVRSKIKTCLLDLNMPNVSGFDVMDHFKEKGFFVRTPVAVISGAEDAETLDRAKSYPIIDVLAKPFNERDVQRVVEKCLACYF
jgi:CheY-like chemotaxis protein/HPt (histidine-containing phosphotransfer) domain-containing protein